MCWCLRDPAMRGWDLGKEAISEPRIFVSDDEVLAKLGRDSIRGVGADQVLALFKHKLDEPSAGRVQRNV